MEPLKTKAKRPNKKLGQDSPWKIILGKHFEDFLAFAFLHIHSDVDWAKGYEQLDTELAKIKRGSKTGKRLADKLFKVYMLSGEEKWLLIHLEVQGYHDILFAERMYTYKSLIWLYFRHKVISLAVFTDSDTDYHPNVYVERNYGCNTTFEYPFIKLLDYRYRLVELERSSNLFSLVILAHFKAQEARKVLSKKYKNQEQLTAAENELVDWKLHFVKLLNQRRYPESTAADVFEFMDSQLMLPIELEQRFEQRVKQEIEVQEMANIGGYARLNLERGHKEATLDDINLLMSKKLGQPLLPALSERISQLPLEQLKRLLVALLDFTQESDLINWLEAHTGVAAN